MLPFEMTMHQQAKEWWIGSFSQARSILGATQQG
jgi:hypothetical protein